MSSSKVASTGRASPELPESYIESDTDTVPYGPVRTRPRGRGGGLGGRGRGFRGRGRAGLFQGVHEDDSTLRVHSEASDHEKGPPRDAHVGAQTRPGGSPRRKLKDRPKRVFGVPRSRVDSALPDDYEHRYPEDEFGEEMGPGARVWRVYLDEVALHDRDMVEGWRDSIDVLLVFAGLFSAVVTAFVIQTSQKLDNNFGEISASLLTELVALQRAVANGGPIDDVPPAEITLNSRPNFGRIDLWVNGLWFTSLAFSLVTALAATLVKQWIRHYVSLPSGTPRERVRLHHFRYMGIQQWSVPVIIGVLPLFIHTALFLFFAGLIAFLSKLSGRIAWAVGVIGLDACAAYLVTTLIPLRYPQCPYRTPLIVHGHMLGSFVASTVHNSLRFITRRMIPHLLLHISGVKFKDGRLWTWCRKTLEAHIPEYITLSQKEIEIQAAEHNGIYTDVDATRWLLDFSSNSSVRDIALQAFSGVYDVRQKEAATGTGLEKKLKDTVRTELQSVVRRYYRDHNPAPLARQFAASSQFTELERLLRATMLIFNNRVFSSRNISKVITALLRSSSEEVDEQRLIAYLAYGFSACGNSGHDLSLSNDELVRLTRNSFLMSEINQHPMANHPLIWRGFFLILHRFTHIFHGCTSVGGFLDTYNCLEPLLDTIVLSELSRPGLATPENIEHLQVSQSMARFAYMVIGVTLPKSMSSIIPVPMHDRGRYDLRFDEGHTIHLQLWAIVMKMLIAACKGSDPYELRFALCGHLSRLSLFCHQHLQAAPAISDGDFMTTLAVLDDLYHQPFFRETQWGPNTYMEFFFLYLKLEVHHDTGPMLITPLLHMIPTHIGERSFVVGLFKALNRLMRSPTPTTPMKRISAISCLVKGVIDCFLKLHEGEDVGLIVLVFEVILEIDWIENVIKNIGAMTHRDPPALHWKPILPLVHVLLEISLAYCQPAIEDEVSTDVHDCAGRILHEVTTPSVLNILCEMYICLPLPNRFPLKDVRSPGPEARVLLRLAEISGDGHGWREYIGHLAKAFTDFHGSKHFDKRRQRWSEANYQQYQRVTDLIGELKNELHITGEEYEMPRIEGPCDSGTKSGDVTVSDVKGEDSEPRAPTVETFLHPVMRSILPEKRKDETNLDMV